MFEGKLTKTDSKGRVSYNRNIVSSIVTLAASEVDGVVPFDESMLRKHKACRIDFVDNEVYVDVNVKLKQGFSVPEIAHKIQENVKRGVDTMTTFAVREVNVFVVGVEF